MRGVLSWLSLGPALAAVALWQLRPTWFIDRLGSTDAWLGAASSRPPAARDVSALERGEPVRVSIDRERAVARVDPRFLSVAVDTSQLLGGRFWSASGRVEVGRGSERVPPLDLRRSALIERARALAPAYLRVGGTEADHVYYAVGGARGSARPREYELELDEPTWNALGDFTRAAGLELMFTVNAGPSARDDDGAWRPDNAEQLFEYAASRGDSVAVWELGNEVNGYWFIHGLSRQPSGEQYGRDLWAFRQALERHFDTATVAGPASVFFPGLGEPLFAWFDFMPDALRAGGPALDILSWHYYPAQSRRCPVATRRARPGQLLAPSELDEVEHWSSQLEQLRERWAPRARLWLGETGPAQCGGEPGLSDRYASGLWWLDQLGQAARSGHAVVVRQTLVGSDYGLLDGTTLEPRPDYYNSLLWRKLMGEVVLDVRVSTGNPYLRAYAHCSAEPGGGVSLLVLNVHPQLAASFELADAPGELTLYALSAPSLDSRRLYLNGERLGRPASTDHDRADGVGLARVAVGDGRFDDGVWLQGQPIARSDAAWTLAPASYVFIALPDSDATSDDAACSSASSRSASNALTSGVPAPDGPISDATAAERRQKGQRRAGADEALTEK
jgi:heparanase 1